MDPHLCIGIDVGCKAHRVGIASPLRGRLRLRGRVFIFGVCPLRGRVFIFGVCPDLPAWQ